MTQPNPKRPDKVQILNPQRGKAMPRIDARKYTLVRRAILHILRRSQVGIPFGELADRVSWELTPGERDTLGSIAWYTTVVKLDLEARGEIERVPGATPQRLRRR